MYRVALSQSMAVASSCLGPPPAVPTHLVLPYLPQMTHWSHMPDPNLSFYLDRTLG